MRSERQLVPVGSMQLTDDCRRTNDERRWTCGDSVGILIKGERKSSHVEPLSAKKRKKFTVLKTKVYNERV